MEKYSGNHPRFSGASSPLNDNLTNREIRKAEKAGKAYAQSMEVGISEKKKQRKTEKSNRKIMKALGTDTYFNKTADGHVRFAVDNMSDKDHELLKISGDASKASRTRYKDDMPSNTAQLPRDRYYSSGIRLKDWPSAEKVIQDRFKLYSPRPVPKIKEPASYPKIKEPQREVLNYKWPKKKRG